MFHSYPLPLPLFPSALGFPAPWHSVRGKTQPVDYCLWTHVQPFHSVYFFHSVLCLVCHKERKGGKASVILAQHFSTPTWKQGGNPQHVVYLVLTSMSLRILHKAFSLRKQRDLGWNLSQLFGECRGPPQVGNDVGERLNGQSGAGYGCGCLLCNSWVLDPFCFWNTIAWYFVCSFFSPVDLSVSISIWKIVFSQHPIACFIPLRASCFLISDIIYMQTHYCYCSTVTCNDHLE